MLHASSSECKPSSPDLEAESCSGILELCKGFGFRVQGGARPLCRTPIWLGSFFILLEMQSERDSPHGVSTAAAALTAITKFVVVGVVPTWTPKVCRILAILEVLGRYFAYFGGL